MSLASLGPPFKDIGCAGMSNVEYGLIMQEMERGDSGLRSFASVQSSLVMYPIYTFGSEEQKQRWLPAMAKGEKLGCFGLTEPDAGSNPGAMRTRAVPDGDGYVLNGEKMWITSGSIADVAVVWAKSEEHGGKVRGFLVENDRPGFVAEGRAWKVVAARLGYVVAFAARRADSKGKPPAENFRAEISTDVPEPGAVRDRMGSDRRGHVVL